MADWSLIPIRPLTVFLGPNSAGKSAVSDAIKYFRKLYGYETDYDIQYGDRKTEPRLTYVNHPKELLPSIGFSFNYPKINDLEEWLESSSYEAQKPLSDEYYSGLFPILKKLNDDQDFLKNTRITIIASSYAEYDMDVYLNNQLVSHWFGEGPRSHITFADVLFKDFFKSDLSNIQNQEINVGLGTNSKIRFHDFPHYAYSADWGGAI